MDKLKTLYEYLEEINFEKRTKETAALYRKVGGENTVFNDWVVQNAYFSVVQDLFGKILDDLMKGDSNNDTM